VKKGFFNSEPDFICLECKKAIYSLCGKAFHERKKCDEVSDDPHEYLNNSIFRGYSMYKTRLLKEDICNKVGCP
jgi:hypothetical protein